MNNYTISCSVNNKLVSIPKYVHFTDMFESFLLLVEEAQQKKHPIDNVFMTYKDSVLATDVQSIIKIGTVISGFDIMITDAISGKCIMKYTPEIMFENKNNFSVTSDVQVSIVGRRQQIYSVLQSPVIAQNLRTYFTMWETESNKAWRIVQDYVLNSELQKNVDMNWTLQYYAPDELKRALSVIDTDPAEAKKILMVMDYMLSSKVKI